MKPQLHDPRTGAKYPVETLDEWGMNGVGDGYGPVPIAFHFTEDPRTGAMQVAGRKGGYPTPLVVEMVPDNTAAPDLEAQGLRFSRGFNLKGKKIPARPGEAGA